MVNGPYEQVLRTSHFVLLDETVFQQDDFLHHQHEMTYSQPSTYLIGRGARACN